MSYTEAQFQKAADIIKSLPEDGPVKPTQEDQLYVSNSRMYDRSYFMLASVLQLLQARSVAGLITLSGHHRRSSVATIGDNTTPAPGMFDFKGKAKWYA